MNRVPDHTFIWRIENFSLNTCVPGKCIGSSAFVSKRLDDSEWGVILYPRGETSALSDFVSLAFIRMRKGDRGPRVLDLEFETAIVASDGAETRFEGTWFARKAQSVSVKRFVKRDALFKEKGRYLPGDALTLQLKMWRMDLPVVPTMTVARSVVKSEKKCFTWTIEDFGVSHGERSTLISTSSEPELFEMILRSSGSSNEPTQYAITIRQRVSSARCIYVDGRLTTGDSDDGNNAISTAEGCHVFPDHCVGHRWTFPSFPDVGTLVPGSTLKLHCDFLIVNGDLEPLTDENSILPVDVDAETTLMDHVKRLHRTREFADVILRTGTVQTPPVHKWILGARSPVLLYMLRDLESENHRGTGEVEDIHRGDELEIGETKLDVLEIPPDVGPSTLRRLLKFLYTDTLDVGDLGFDAALKLLTVAIGLEIPLLRLECLDFLRSKLNLSNFYRALVLADITEETQLRDYAQNFIADHRKEILLSDDWKDFVDERPSLARQVMRYLRSGVKVTIGGTPVL